MGAGTITYRVKVNEVTKDTALRGPVLVMMTDDVTVPILTALTLLWNCGFVFIHNQLRLLLCEKACVHVAPAPVFPYI